MSIMAVFLKIFLFFAIFYASIGVSTFLAKKIRERQEKNRDSKSDKKD